MISELFTPAPFLVVLAVAALYAVVCRIRHMDKTTWWVVRWQHCSLASGFIGALVVSPEWAGVSIGLGVVLFLAFSSPRWRNGLPGTMARPPKVERFPWAG